MTCDVDCPPTFTQDPADKLDYTVDFERFLALRWERETTYASSDRRRPTVSNGFEYECTTAGQTGAKEPTWPRVTGQTVADGSVVWTCRALSTASLRTTLSTATWTADTGITSSSATVVDQAARALLEGGTDGQQYQIRVEGTMANGTKRNIVFVLKVERSRCLNG